MIDVTGNENEAKDEDKNEAENEDKNEHEDLEEAPTKNDGTDAERYDTTESDTISNTMDKQYVARARKNMRYRKRKCYLPPKLRIHLTINMKRSKILHANTMAQTMGNPHLNLRDYAPLHATIHCGPNQHENVICNPLITTILTQYHVSKGIKVFGEFGVAAVLKELKQLHKRMVIDPKNADKTTTSKKRAALQYLMFLKQKICRTVKGRGCADDRKQRKYLTRVVPAPDENIISVSTIVHLTNASSVIDGT